MNRKETNKLYQWKAILDFLSGTKDKWSTLPAFADHASGLEAANKLVIRHGRTQKQGTRPITTQKNEARAQAITLATQAVLNLQVWARDRHQDAILASLAITHRQLDEEPDAALTDSLQYIAEVSATHLDELAGYGTDEKALTLLQDAIARFSGLVARPKAMSAHRQTATGGIKATVRTGNAHLGELDRLVGNFSVSDPEFVAEFRNVRTSVHSGVRHRKGGKQQQ